MKVSLTEKQNAPWESFNNVVIVFWMAGVPLIHHHCWKLFCGALVPKLDKFKQFNLSYQSSFSYVLHKYSRSLGNQSATSEALISPLSVVCYLWLVSVSSLCPGLRRWEGSAVWSRRPRCCCLPLPPCRRRLSTWSTTWALRLASNWTCSQL